MCTFGEWAGQELCILELLSVDEHSLLASEGRRVNDGDFQSSSVSKADLLSTLDRNRHCNHLHLIELREILLFDPELTNNLL